jgi:zinc transport system permease protein
MSYLFGSLATVSAGDVLTTAILAGVITAAAVGARWALLAVTADPAAARAAGLPTRVYTVALAAMAALTVTTAMRVVGLLLVSALMIVPVAAAQLWTKSFATTMGWAAGLGLAMSVAGLITSYWYDLPPGATIVVVAIAFYALAALVRPARWRRGTIKQGQSA